MTKEEIKFYKEQQKRVEEGYAFKIKALQEDIKRRDELIATLTSDNDSLKGQIDSLKEQIAHLQSGLTGDEVDYLEAF